jgi:hypothetical protein
VLAKVLRPFTVFVAFLCLAALGAPSAGVAADEAAWMYDPDAVVEIDLGGLSAEEVDALEAEPDEYQAGTFELKVDGQVQGPPLGEVGIRLKGSWSFRPLDEKAAFKVKFDEYVDDQTFFGLERLTLNNMVQDPSMVHETLTYELFRAMSLPASRTGYAFVHLNGAAYGLYLNLETLDEISLPRWFASTGHLYEADKPGVDVEPGDAGAFEVDRGDDEDLGDLEALIAAANGGAGDWSDGLSGIADLEQMTRMWAVERYSGHFDGYAGAVGFPPNNYYLHSDGDGLYTMLPWGADQTWKAPVDFGQRAGGRLFTGCLADASCCGELYVNALEEVGFVVGARDLGARAVELAEMLAPYQALETEPRREYTAAEIEDGLDATLASIAARPAELAEWLGAGDPCAFPSESSEGEQSEAPLGENRFPEREQRQGQPALPRGIRIGSFRFRGALVLTGVEAPGSGILTQRVAVKTRRGWRTACATRVLPDRGGWLTLRCRLSAEFRRRLETTSLPLKISTDFRPNAGERSSVSRRLTAPRLTAD